MPAPNNRRASLPSLGQVPEHLPADSRRWSDEVHNNNNSAGEDLSILPSPTISPPSSPDALRQQLQAHGINCKRGRRHSAPNVAHTMLTTRAITDFDDRHNSSSCVTKRTDSTGSSPSTVTMMHFPPSPQLPQSILRHRLSVGVDHVLHKKILESMRSLQFDVFNRNEKELIDVLLELFDALGIIAFLKIDRRRCKQFLVAVALSYRDNPYHSFKHAFDMTQALYVIVQRTRLESLLPVCDLAALFIASICHDCDHPGNSNSFEVATESQLAIRYSDISVLENHHCATAFDILRNGNGRILDELPPDVYKDMRSMIIHSILGTDMGKHNEIVQSFRDIISDPMGVENMLYTSSDERKLLRQMLLKCADISNPCRSSFLAREWDKLVKAEFYQEGDKTRMLELPVLPHMDRTTDKPYLSSANFSRFVVLPLFNSFDNFLRKAFPETKSTGLEEFLSNTAANIEMFEMLSQAV